ncbi:hypothetical protein [Neochlamydia sp. AcF65]|uniref:hypothetical protein n=1 Tax=Neochlamydia sp. AcF65 TaxID=2795735 RepID=UPI001BC9D087|nr:hypothetical protein [Neochlamydia sp. AcF65]
MSAQYASLENGGTAIADHLLGGGGGKTDEVAHIWEKCGAKARTNNPQPCRQLAIENGLGWLHGEKPTGAKAKEGSAIQKKMNHLC